MRSAPHPFTLRQLQYAVWVAEFKSFRRASETCRVAQPSLSAQIAALEQAVGVRLFERDRSGVLLTAAGEVFVARARQLLADADDLLTAVEGLGDPLVGTLRIGVIPTLAPYLLPDVVPALGRDLPSLVVHWVEDRTDALVAAVSAGSMDGALLALEARLEDLEHEVLGQDRFVLAAAPSHPILKRRGAARLEELKDLGVLLLDDGHCLRDQALAVCGRASARELDFRATSLATLVQMVARGVGVTLLPELAVSAELRRADIETRPFAAPQPSRTLVLAWRKRAAREPALRALAQSARGAYERARKRARLPEGR